jgi:hypothetical protein
LLLAGSGVVLNLTSLFQALRPDHIAVEAHYSINFNSENDGLSQENAFYCDTFQKISMV